MMLPQFILRRILTARGLLAAAVVFLLLGAHGASHASFDLYCKQSGNPNAQYDCVKASETAWSYGGGSYPFTLSYSGMKSLEDVVNRLLADIGAWPGWCSAPTITPEGAWVTGTANQVRLSQTHLLRTYGVTGSGNCTPTPSNTVDSTYTAYATRDKTFFCPAGEQGPFTNALGDRYCTTRTNMCVTPHPVAIASGKKFYAEVYDAPLFHSFHFFRSYLSIPGVNHFGLLNQPKPQPDDPPDLDEPVPHHDVVGWKASYDARIWISSNQAGTNVVFNVDIPGRGPRVYLESGGVLTSLQNDAGTLVRLTDGRFVHRDPSLLVWEFSASGALLSISRSGGGKTTLSYDGSGRLQSATDSFGSTLQFTLNSDGSLQRITTPDGEYHGYAVVNGVMQSVSFPTIGGVRHQRGYYYEDPAYVAAVTGEFDELGHRISTFSYESTGRVARTVLHAAAGTDVAEHRFDYSSAPSSTKVQDPLGTIRNFGFVTSLGATYLSSMSQPGGSGCAAASKSTLYDGRGNPIAIDAFNNTRTCVFSEAARGLQLVRVEALAQYSTCGGYDSPAVTLPAGSRKVSTQWHPEWALRTRFAEPGRITTYVYNGQPDLFNGNAVASCAPASALLPDGKPIAVLCKQVEQATTDANGALGFGAVLQSGVPNRVSTWTYNQWGQVLTENGPRTDVNDTTSYVYYSDTTADHMPGDLQSMTNAAGRVTTYGKYNRHGQLLESTDPNGVVTVNTYDLRQRLLSTTVGGQTTSYQYDPVGQLKRVTLPDQSWVGYDYDDAHRQVAVYDNKGNRTEYQLDNAGNRTGETTRDPGGALKRQLTRSIDALGRVQQTTGRE